MKLLLTSAGITNDSIRNALLDLLDKPLEQTKVAFIPTASTIEPGDKNWVIDEEINSFLKIGKWAQFDIVDIAALERKFWEPRLAEADVLYAGGGDDFFLMYHISKSGLKKLLPEWLETKIWVGISAGSQVMGRRIDPELIKQIYEVGTVPPYDKVEKFLEYVDFSIKPHMNSENFPKVSEENLAKHAQQIDGTFYTLDDDSAIKVVDEEVEIISEGKWKKYN